MASAEWACAVSQVDALSRFGACRSYLLLGELHDPRVARDDGALPGEIQLDDVDADVRHLVHEPDPTEPGIDPETRPPVPGKS